MVRGGLCATTGQGPVPGRSLCLDGTPYTMGCKDGLWRLGDGDVSHRAALTTTGSSPLRNQERSVQDLMLGLQRLTARRRGHCVKPPRTGGWGRSRIGWTVCLPRVPSGYTCHNYPIRRCTTPWDQGRPCCAVLSWARIIRVDPMRSGVKGY